MDRGSPKDDVRSLANWQPIDAERSTEENSFSVVARVLLQDFTRVPLPCRIWRQMRSAVCSSQESTHGVIEPLVPVDLVIDHNTVQGDFSSTKRRV
jgi:aconitase A